MSTIAGGQWLQQLNDELRGSDRACAVLAGAVLDDRVLRLLSSYLLPPKSSREDRLLGRGGPLESFSARIELTRRLNLLAPEVAQSLDWIREIRNDAAHREQFSFSDNGTQDRVNNIVEALELRTRGPNLLSKPYDSAKGHFVACTAMLAARIQLEATLVKGPQHEPVQNAELSIGA